MCYRVEIPATDALPCIRISLQLTIRPCEDSEELHRYHPGRDFTMRCVQCGSTGSNLEANSGPKEEESGISTWQPGYPSAATRCATCRHSSYSIVLVRSVHYGVLQYHTAPRW